MSSIIIVLPKIEDAKKIKKILMQHGFDNTYHALQVPLLLWK